MTKLSVSPGEQRRAFLLILVIVCVPLLGTVAAVISTGETDLSDLTPLHPRTDDGYVLLDWPSLQRDHPHAMVAIGRDSAAFNGAVVQTLGYVAEGDRPFARGKKVRNFILLPDRGNLLHPAHRMGDQMIAVRLREAALLTRGELVWVWGTLQLVPGDPNGSLPLYSLDQAWTQVADKADVHDYFGADRP